jgi:WD40 repeat protein
MQALVKYFPLFDFFGQSTFHIQSVGHDSSKEPSHDLDLSQLCDNNDVVRIDIDSMELDLLCIDPFIRIHVCNTSTGKSVCIPAIIGKKYVYATAQSKTCNGASQWNGTVIIKVDYRRILDQSTIILFEVLECGYLAGDTTISNNACNDDAFKGSNSIAWGFLKPISKNGTVNVGTREPMISRSENDDCKEANIDSLHFESNAKRCRLQLFSWQYESWYVQRQARRLGFLSSNIPLVFQQYLRQRRKSLLPFLSIRIAPHQNMCTRQSPDFAPKTYIQEDREDSKDGEEIIEHQNQDNNIIKDEVKGETNTIDLIHEYSRLPNDKCLIPDHLFMTLNHCGAAALAFSHSGEFLAVASNTHQLHVHNLCTGETIYVASYHHHGHILNLAWSLDDSIVACASKDGTFSVHLIKESKMMADNERCHDIQFVEPPLHPRALIFHPFSSKIPVIVIGLSDGKVALWNLASTLTDSNMDLLGRVQRHHQAVSAITCDASNGRLYTGDDGGNIIIWKPKSEQIMKGSDFEVLFQIRSNVLHALSSKSILHLSLRCQACEKRDGTGSKGKELLITAQNDSMTLFNYDLTSHQLTNFCIDAEGKQAEFKMATFSPDGRYVVGGTNNGKLLVMDACGIQKKVNSTCKN